MPDFKRYILNNGLKLIVNEDKSTPMVAINILYKVGSRNENPEKTGFAHLFEHLMFGGSVNIPSFDEPLQMVGGENNAFTSSDITNYYITLPAENIETGLWLESDRMQELDFSEQSLNVQQNVVIEEFRQRYLNQPYGDVWLLMNPLVFNVHPYQWPTIGKNTNHIQDATLEDVKKFFYSHYAPNNAIMCISGNIESDYAYELVNKWFGSIETRQLTNSEIPAEPEQTEYKELTVKRNVPFDGIYMAWHIPGRDNDNFLIFDFITDILAGGRSGKLFQKLVKEQCLFSDINAYVTGSIDPGLLVVYGKVLGGVPVERAYKAIEDIMGQLSTERISDEELQKVKNKFEANFLLGQTSILNKAMGLCYFEMMGDANLFNKETDKYQAITADDVLKAAQKTIVKTNCSTLFYLADK